MTIRALLIGYSVLVIVVAGAVWLIGRAVVVRKQRAVSDAWLKDTAYDKDGDRV